MSLNKKRLSSTAYLVITGYNNEYYCKIVGNGEPDKLWYTFLFGGTSTYCITISTKGNTPTEASLDRVDYDVRCNKDSSLEKGGGMTKLLSIALWLIKFFFPTIKNITLTDDSHIECIQGKKMKKMSLASDYILKYNMTWYEKSFHAILPDTLYNNYKNSMNILTEELDDYEYQVSRLPYLEKYKDIYLKSTTPKQFFENLRNHYGMEYCSEVCDWIHKYITILGINLYNQSWYIPTNTITIPSGFSMKRIEKPVVGGKKYTRKCVRKYIDDSRSSIGVYESN